MHAPPSTCSGPISSRSLANADQVHDAGLDHGHLPHGVDGLGQALEAAADRDADILDTPVLDLGQHREPELRPFPAVPGPQPEDVAFAVDADRSRRRPAGAGPARRGPGRKIASMNSPG